MSTQNDRDIEKNVWIFQANPRHFNILKALKWAKNNGLVAVDFERIGDSRPEIQENQLVALHEVAKIIEEAFV